MHIHNLKGEVIHTQEGNKLIKDNFTVADLRGTGIKHFHTDRHLCFVHEDLVRLGCHAFKRADINIEMLKELGSQEGYSIYEISTYSDIILTMIKE